MFDGVTLALVILTFLLAGGVKGVIGLGLPTISLALLTVTIGLHSAMALFLAPSLATNFWQAVTGGNARMIAVRLWPFLLAATATVWIGAGALTRVDVSLLSAMLGALLVAFSLVSLTRPQVSIPRRWEPWAGPIAGITNGILTGMTGSFVFPGILYLQALGLSRDALIQAMGMLFTASTVALAVSLGGQRLLTLELGAVSAAAVLPALIGMVLGRRLRQKLSETTFRRMFFLSLLVLGAAIIARSVT